MTECEEAYKLELSECRGYDGEEGLYGSVKCVVRR